MEGGENGDKDNNNNNNKKKNVEMEMGKSCGGQVNSRWNPTKEQIGMLESLYRQGIRTPSAEQIQQITARLKAFGHIEGKNVFYWFQNHKARQRQKQKQESLAYLNQYLHPHHHHLHQPLFAPPCPNVVCGTYYMPQSDLGFYPQYPKVLLPGSVKRRPRTEKMDHKPKTPFHDHNNNHVMMRETSRDMNQKKETISYYNNINGTIDQEALPLFPLHPTGVLQERPTMCSSSVASFSNENSLATASTSSEATTNGIDEGSCDVAFFNFLSGGGICEGDN